MKKYLAPPCETIKYFIDDRDCHERLSSSLDSGSLRLLLSNRKRITEQIAEILHDCICEFRPEYWIERQREYEKRAANCGDLLKIEKGIIGHQVNCQGKMGAGLAGKIAKLYPEVLTKYREYLSLCGPSDALGEYTVTNVNPDLSVLNLFGQLNYGRDGRCYTDYIALQSIANELKKWEIMIHLPARMGCGLAGGDWNIVQDIFAGVDVIWVEGK